MIYRTIRRHFEPVSSRTQWLSTCTVCQLHWNQLFESVHGFSAKESNANDVSHMHLAKPFVKLYQLKMSSNYSVSGGLSWWKVAPCTPCFFLFFWKFTLCSCTCSKATAKTFSVNCRSDTCSFMGTGSVLIKPLKAESFSNICAKNAPPTSSLEIQTQYFCIAVICKDSNGTLAGFHGHSSDTARWREGLQLLQPARWKIRISVPKLSKV